MFQMCYYHQHACLLVCLSLLPACLSVSQTSVDDSGHKGNTGQLLNSRVLGVLWWWLSLQPNFKKVGLTGPQLLEQGCWERGGDFFQGGGCNCHIIN